MTNNYNRLRFQVLASTKNEWLTVSSIEISVTLKRDTVTSRTSESRKFILKLEA